jgi:hypothetical protein
VPRIFDEEEQIKFNYSIEPKGTTWHKAPAPHLG